jgi:twitching motility protein PilT
VSPNGNEFFNFGAQVPVPPKARPGGPAPMSSVPVVAVPAPHAPPVVHVVEALSPADLNGDGGISLDEMLTWIVANGASDLHLSAGNAPSARLHGALSPIPSTGVISAAHLEQMLTAVMNERQRETFAATHDMDLAYALGHDARFRVNIFRQRGRIGAVMRAIPTKVRTVEEMEIPDSLRALAGLARGLVLVTGPTGSGKSTLLASLIDLANRTRRAHILTIEDPIEFTHNSKLAVVTQREVHEDTESFSSGLRAGLRQDPDIILVGEMRDLETTQAAIEAAETGHLVFGTMHTKSAPETVSRAVNMFPKEVQNQIQTTLASCLEAVITQTLVPTIDGSGRCAAREVMMLGPDSRNLIRSGKLEQLPTVLQTGFERGMYTLNADLARLVKENKISYETAAECASDLTELDGKLGRASSTRAPSARR